MKASELIELLQQRIEEYGDLPVWLDGEFGPYPITTIDHCERRFVYPERFELNE